jgi:O-antigen/teichoic acid export membrane protein
LADIKQGKLARNAGSAVLWNTLFVPLKLLAEVAVTLVKANILSQAAFGLLAILAAFANTLGLWVDLGVDRALPKYLPEQERVGGKAAVARLLRTVARIKLLMLLVVTLLFLLYSGPILARLAQDVRELDIDPIEHARLLNDLGRYGWLLMGGVLLLVALGAFYDMLMAYLISFFRHRAWNSIALVTSLVGPPLVIAAVLLDSGVPGVLLAMVVTPFISVALAAWQVALAQRSLAASSAPQAAEQRHERAEWLPQGFARYTSVSHLLNLSDWATSPALPLLLLPSLPQVAVFQIGFQLVRMVLTYLFTPLAGVQVPLFSRVRGGEGDLQQAYASISRLLTLLMVPGAVGVALLARPLLSGLFPTFVEAAPLVWVLAPCLFLDSLLSTAQIVLMVYERYRAVLLARLLAFVSVPLLLLLPLLPAAYTLLGAAAALGLARLLARAASLYFGQRELQLGFPGAFAARVGLASAVMVLPLLLGSSLLGTLSPGADITARLAYLVAIALLAALAAAVFFAALRLMGGLHPADRAQLLALKLPFKKLLVRVI